MIYSCMHVHAFHSTMNYALFQNSLTMSYIKLFKICPITETQMYVTIGRYRDT